MTADPTITLVETACRACQEKKAHDLIALDVRGLTSLADAFVFCSGNTSRQVKAIADEVHHQLKEAGYTLHATEGAREAVWVLLDYGDLVVHVFEQEMRDFYNLERLWGEAPRIDIPAEPEPSFD